MNNETDVLLESDVSQYDEITIGVRSGISETVVSENPHIFRCSECDTTDLMEIILVDEDRPAEAHEVLLSKHCFEKILSGEISIEILYEDDHSDRLSTTTSPLTSTATVPSTSTISSASTTIIPLSTTTTSLSTTTIPLTTTTTPLSTTATPFSRTTTTVPSAPVTTSASTSTSWHNILPSEWIQVASRDANSPIDNLTVDPPHTDAFVLGMPTKRRRLILTQRHRNLQPASELVTEGLDQAIRATGLTNSNDVERNTQYLSSSFQDMVTKPWLPEDPRFVPPAALSSSMGGNVVH